MSSKVIIDIGYKDFLNYACRLLFFVLSEKRGYLSLQNGELCAKWYRKLQITILLQALLMEEESMIECKYSKPSNLLNAKHLCELENLGNKTTSSKLKIFFNGSALRLHKEGIIQEIMSRNMWGEYRTRWSRMKCYDIWRRNEIN